MNGITERSTPSLEADFKTAQEKVAQINPNLVFELMKGRAVDPCYESRPEVREFRLAFQRLHTTKLYA